MTALASKLHPKHRHKMPEFEEHQQTDSQAESYTPSTDATAKPRTRRRSGGFKTDAASASKGNMGPVNPTEALKEEKLSGSGQPAAANSAPRSERSDRPERSERAPRKERAPRSERPAREDKPRKERAPRKERPVANPQPSAETLAAIATVEARLAERKTERDARRAERDKNRPAKKERKPAAKKTAKKAPRNKPQPKGGIIAAITGFFGKLFGAEPEPAKKTSGNRGGQNRGKGGNRGNQNRRGGQNRGKGGKGQNRRQGGNREGKGRRQASGEKRHTAASLSNES